MRCIICIRNLNDRGMGKTLEMLALIVHNIGESDARPSDCGGTLVIVPQSVIHHWANEIREKICQNFCRVYIYYGSNRYINIQD